MSNADEVASARNAAVDPAVDPPDNSVDLEPARFGRTGALLALLGSLYLALNELSVLSGKFVLESGAAASTFIAMSSPGGWREQGHWDDVLTGSQRENWRDLLWFFATLDFVFIAGYLLAVVLLVGKMSGVATTVGESGLSWPWRWDWPNRRVAMGFAVVAVALAIVDCVENVGHLWLAQQRDSEAGVDAGLAQAAVWVTGLKWLLVAVLVLAALAWLFRAMATAPFWRRTRTIAHALWIQRFSLFAFLPVAALTLLPFEELNNLFGQLPDVQRAWLDGPEGLWHSFVAAVAIGALALGIFIQGRYRSDWAARRVAGHSGPWPFFNLDGTVREPHRRLWLVGPLLLGVLALVVWIAQLLGSGAQVFPWRLVLFCLPPLAVVVISSRYSVLSRDAARDRLRERSLDWATTVMAVGDILAVTALSLAGLGMVRAFTGVVALHRADLVEADYVVQPVVALVIGLLVAVAPWVFSEPLLRAFHKTRPQAEAGARARTLGAPEVQTRPERTTGWGRALDRLARDHRGAARVLAPGYDTFDGPSYEGAADQPRDWSRIVWLGVWVALFLALAAFPRVAYVLGALGAATIALGALFGMLGVLVAHAQDRQPMEVFTAVRGFWFFRGFKSTPIGLVLAVAVLLSASLSTCTGVGRTEIHPVVGAGTIPERPTLEEAFTAWRADSEACQVPYADDPAFDVRPMLLVASEGGGMRATYWTAATLQALSTGQAGSEPEAAVGCGARSTLFAAGASGGALGLTVGRFSDRPRDLVEKMAGPDALAVASVSLATSDLVASLAGLRFPVITGHRDPNWQGLDRAGLMEVTFEREDELEPLRTPFLPEKPSGAVTGHLVLTTTEARNGCRALLSQIDLSDGATFTGPRPDCGQDGETEDFEHSYDLFAAYGRGSEDEEGCLGNPAAFSAGLLASRFPFVTPSGVLDECRGLDSTQMIDGGYSDNFGLGTVAELAPLWTDLVRSHNDTTLQAGFGELIVPMVVYVDNGSPSDYEPPSPRPAPEKPRGPWGWSRSRPIPEILIPFAGRQNAKPHKVSADAALDDAKELAVASLCSDTVPGCAVLRGSAHAAHQAFVVHQSNQPSMPAPLGWVLSEASRDDLDDDLQQQLDRGMSELPNDPAALHDYASLHDLLVALGIVAK